MIELRYQEQKDLNNFNDLLRLCKKPRTSPQLEYLTDSDSSTIRYKCNELVKFGYMTKEKVTAHAVKYSKSYNTPGTPWKTEFDAMATKTVVKNLLTHWGFLSVEIMQSMNDDDVDVAEKVRDHIATNGNRKDMSFENVPDADVAEEHHSFSDNGGPGF